jgi:hypothetical protein
MRLQAGWATLVLSVSTLPLSGGVAAQTAPQPPAAAAAKSAIEECVAGIDEQPLGLPAMELRCPNLQAALQAAGLRPLIIDSSLAVFNRSSLHDLSTLIHPAAGPAPSVAALTEVLNGLHPARTPTQPWWRRLLDWLSEHLAPKQPDGSSYAWLGSIGRLLSRLHWLWTGIVWGTLIALPIAVAILVVREVRAMGRRSIDDPLTAAANFATGPLESRLALLRKMPPEERPAPLFALLISRLVAAGRLPPDRSLTHREIARRALLDDAEQRRLIESLARLSERQLYCSVATTPAGLDALLAHGEDLYTTGWGRPAAN